MPRRSPSPRRGVIALDWGVAETLIALGHPPLGCAEVASYNRAVVTPQMPPSVIDVGLRFSPNPELMVTLAPDLILINGAQAFMRTSLEPFGPVEVVPIYTAAGQPYQQALDATQQLAAKLDDPAAATRLLADASAVMTTARTKLQRYDGRPLCIIGFEDAGHIGIATPTSLFQGVLDQLGLRNAWKQDGGPVGRRLCRHREPAERAGRPAGLSHICARGRETNDRGEAVVASAAGCAGTPGCGSASSLGLWCHTERYAFRAAAGRVAGARHDRRVKERIGPAQSGPQRRGTVTAAGPPSASMREAQGEKGGPGYDDPSYQVCRNVARTVRRKP